MEYEELCQQYGLFPVPYCWPVSRFTLDRAVRVVGFPNHRLARLAGIESVLRAPVSLTNTAEMSAVFPLDVEHHLQDAWLTISRAADYARGKAEFVKMRAPRSWMQSRVEFWWQRMTAVVTPSPASRAYWEAMLRREMYRAAWWLCSSQAVPAWRHAIDAGARLSHIAGRALGWETPCLASYQRREDMNSLSLALHCSVVRDLLPPVLWEAVVDERTRGAYYGAKSWNKDIMPHRWRGFSSGALGLALDMVQTGGPSNLHPILADAVEDGPSFDGREELLAHLRQPQRHFEGCWAVEWVAGYDRAFRRR